MEYEAIEKQVNELQEIIIKLSKTLGEITRELAEKIGELFDNLKNIDMLEKPKFKPVKSLIKPYKQPFIKVRYRARANL